MRDDPINAEFLKHVRAELQRARAKHPTNQRTLELLNHYVKQLETEMTMDASAVTIFSTCVNIATMVSRIVEEGDAKYKYASYRQNPGPLFRGEDWL